MYWNLIWKSPGFVQFGTNLTHFEAKPTIPGTTSCEGQNREDDLKLTHGNWLFSWVLQRDQNNVNNSSKFEYFELCWFHLFFPKNRLHYFISNVHIKLYLSDGHLLTSTTLSFRVWYSVEKIKHCLICIMLNRSLDYILCGYWFLTQLDSSSEMQLFLAFLHRGVRFGDKMSQIGPECHKSGDIIQYSLTRRVKMYMKHYPT